MKKIEIYSHINRKCIVLPNGDKYDSRLELYDDEGKLVFETNNVNVDSSNNYNYKVELKNGEYAGIVGLHRGEYPAIFVFKKDGLEKVNSISDFSKLYNLRILESLYSNPNHNGNTIVIGVNIHKGGSKWDWSAGCITIYKDDYENFIKYFKMNEKCIVNKR
jgi:hypothetical protein